MILMMWNGDMAWGVRVCNDVDWCRNQMHNMFDLMMWHGDMAWGGGWHGTSATCAKFIVVFENWREN